MNKAKESLEANMAEILANIPAEFKADLEKEIAAATSPAPLSGADEVAAIKAELVANPEVDESEAAGELGDVKAPEPAAVATKEETDAEMAELLKGDHTKEA